MIYVVKKGDTLYSIAQKYSVALDELISLNMFANPESLVVGQTVFIPRNDVVHTVVRGDTMYSIARRYGVPLDTLLAVNPTINPPYLIYPGDKITVPLTQQKLGEMEVNGFVLPNISNSTLDMTLPNLTYLSIFSYRVMPNGSLVDIPDTNIIDKAIQAGVAPLMTITNSLESGGFSGEITQSLFANPVAEDNLIQNVINTLNTKRYTGVVVDFEYIMPSDRDNYTAFLRKLTNALHPMDYVVFSALAPKISGDQQGTLYEAHDYGAVAQIVDRVIIMTYEWGYLFGPPLAVSPVNEVKKVLDYAVTVIQPGKILMGVPNYAYDWTLPFVEGTSARIVSNVEAVNLARTVGANIEFDPVAETPFFYYYKDNKRHVVWFDDARSIDAQLRLVDEYNLAGVSYWSLNRYFPQNWLVQNSLFDIVKI
ncbi:MAG: LysM peptidoglycan-binding domain-containing protein [Clostridia bacterium]|nr:LysM peptidoglycan-binding domain-containing protein [Clostridia bacterium]